MAVCTRLKVQHKWNTERIVYSYTTFSQSHYGHFASLEELCKGLFHAIFMTSRHLPFKTVICMWFTRYIMDREMQIDPKGNCPPVFGQAEVVLKLQRGWLNCRCWVRVVKMSLWFRMSPKWWIPASSVWSLKKKVRIEYFLYTHTHILCWGTVE